MNPSSSFAGPLLSMKHEGPTRFVLTLHQGHLLIESLSKRMTKKEVATRLDTTANGVAYLVEKKLLKVLGHPGRKQRKFFSSTDVMAILQDTEQLGEITDALYEYSRQKRRRPMPWSGQARIGTSLKFAGEGNTE